MTKNERVPLTLLLLLVVCSFSGCLGGLLPSNSSTDTGNTTTRPTDGTGIYKTIDGGKNWFQMVKIEGTTETNLSTAVIGSVTVDPDNTQILYLGTLGDGIYKTENGGDSWKKLSDANNKLAPDASVYDIAVEPGNSSIVYAATLNKARGVLLRSQDAGASWEEKYISAEAGKQVNRVEIDRGSRNLVYLGTEQGGLIKSFNRGESWQDIKWFQSGVKDFVVDYKNPKGIIVLCRHGLFKTTDGGTEKSESWAILTETLTEKASIPTNDVKNISSLTIDAENPLIIYLTYSNLGFITRDGGVSWEKMKTVTPTVMTSKNTPLVKKIESVDNMLYYGAGNVLYKSTDKGQSWTSFDMPVLKDVKYTVTDPKNHDIFYVATAG